MGCRCTHNPRERGSWSYCCRSPQLRDFYCDRAALEREYATKLELLARKVTEKRLKAVAPLVVGSNTENTIKQKTLNHAFVQLTSALSRTAQDHVALANRLASEIVEPLGALGRRGEDQKKKQTQFYQKLLSERDHYYQDCTTKKRKYHDDCAKVESCQKKVTKLLCFPRSVYQDRVHCRIEAQTQP